MTNERDMNKHVAIVVDWYGPYSIENARKVAKEHFSAGLYCGIGKIKYQKSPSDLQYIGITKDLYSRIIDKKHPKLSLITQECDVWLGEVASFGIPGTKDKVTDTQLDLAEWLHSYFLQLPLNDKKTGSPPDTPATVFNRWWQKDFDTPRQKRPHKNWPDLIDFTGIEYGAKVVWNGTKIVKWHPSDF